MKKTDNQPGAFNSSNKVATYPIQLELGRRREHSVKDKVVFTLDSIKIGPFAPLGPYGLRIY